MVNWNGCPKILVKTSYHETLSQTITTAKCTHVILFGLIMTSDSIITNDYLVFYAFKFPIANSIIGISPMG